MLSNNRYIIVCADNLRAYGLQQLCRQHLGNAETVVAGSMAQAASPDQIYDMILTDARTFADEYHFLINTQTPVVVLADNAAAATDDQHISIVPTTLSCTQIAEKIRQLTTRPPHPDECAGKADQLSEREKEVLKYVCKGLINKEIANQLNISLHTVISHRKNITAKLKIKSVPALTIFAIMNGIIPREDIG